MVKKFCNTLRAVRRGIVDVWNAFMVEGATYDAHDIPNCPTTAKSIPKELISWPDAKALHKKRIRNDREYRVHAYIHFYVDDCKFDGMRSSVWLFPRRALRVISHYDGIITPDFSMYQDFPEPIKMFSVYRMRAFGYWVGSMGIGVINNVRWGTKETWEYCFGGLPENDIFSIGIVGSGYDNIENRPMFDLGIRKLVEQKSPKALIVVGSASYSIFDELRSKGMPIIQFDGETCSYFKSRRGTDVETL